jgi:hypothetical protein
MGHQGKTTGGGLAAISRRFKQPLSKLAGLFKRLKKLFQVDGFFRLKSTPPPKDERCKPRKPPCSWLHDGYMEQKKRKGLASANLLTLAFVGAGEMNRTPDLLITNELLYRLSYTGEAPDYRPAW